MELLKRKPTKTIFISILSLAVLSTTAAIASSEGEPDPVLQYYWRGAVKVARESDPARSEISYAFSAKSYYHSLTSGGMVVRTDSIVADYFFTGGILDSQQTTLGEMSRFRNLDLAFPDIFDRYNCLNLFPNDTGGAELAIGMLADSTAVGQPDGLVIIDRNSYYPRRLYLWYPGQENIARLTRSFRFVLVDGFIFPDSIWEVGTRLGIFSKESYRIETGISNVRIAAGEEHIE